MNENVTTVRNRVYHRPPPQQVGGGGRSALRFTGEVLVTLGLVVLLFVFYEVYVTNWFSAGKQANATQTMEHQWRNDRGSGFGALEGQGIARLYIPALGPDYQFTVIQGTSQDDLAVGPGHYLHTAMPGERGNFAVAGHRVGKGAPFNDLDQVQSCDAIVVETAHDWFVYRLLPLGQEVAGWSTGRGRSATCAGADGTNPVVPLGGAYQGLVGQQVVLPSQGEVIDPVPGRPDSAMAPAQRAKLITLTTCHPQFSDRQRLILHGVLVKEYTKGSGAQRPPELKETS